MKAEVDGGPGERGDQRRLFGGLAGATAAVVLVATLFPLAAPDPSPEGLGPGAGLLLCVICGHFGTADFLRNAAFFVPLGLFVHLAFGGRRGLIAALLAGLALSTVVEIGQLVVPGRFSTVGDLLANSVGAGLGGLAGRWWKALARPSAHLAGRFSLAAGAFASGVFLFTGWVLTPRPTGERNWVQWTPEIAQYRTYGGQVMAARLGGIAVAPGRMARSASRTAADAMRTGRPVSATVRAGPRPPGLAPVLSLFDGRQQENLLLGQDRGDLVLRVRYRADDLRLSRPDLRHRGAMADLSVGDTVRLAAWRPPERPRVDDGPRDDAYCLAVDRSVRCGIGLPPGRGWALLAYPDSLGAAAVRALDALWLGLLFFPLGYWGVPRWTAGLGVTLAAGGFVAAPLLTPLVGPSAAGILGALAGVGVGRSIRGGSRRSPGREAAAGADAAA